MLLTEKESAMHEQVAVLSAAPPVSEPNPIPVAFTQRLCPCVRDFRSCKLHARQVEGVGGRGDAGSSAVSFSWRALVVASGTLATAAACRTGSKALAVSAEEVRRCCGSSSSSSAPLQTIAGSAAAAAARPHHGPTLLLAFYKLRLKCLTIAYCY